MKITIVGTGMVGATFAYRLMACELASHIHLVDVNVEKADGERLDIGHAASIENYTKVTSGNIQDSKNSDIIVYCAGIPRQPHHKSRTDLIQVNHDICKQIVPELSQVSPNAIFVVAANPADVLTYAVQKYSGFDKRKVISSGTVVDSARFCYNLAQKLGVNPHDVTAYSLGEHGNSQVPCFESVFIGGISLNKWLEYNNLELTQEDKEDIVKKTVYAGPEIISKKRATYYGISSALVRIIKAIIFDQKAILPVGTSMEGQYDINNIVMSSPSIVGKNGVEKILELDVSKEELEKVKESANFLKQYQDIIDQNL